MCLSRQISDRQSSPGLHLSTMADASDSTSKQCILPKEKVFSIQIGSDLFRLSGASIASDGRSAVFTVTTGRKADPSQLHLTSRDSSRSRYASPNHAAAAPYISIATPKPSRRLQGICKVVTKARRMETKADDNQDTMFGHEMAHSSSSCSPMLSSIAVRTFLSAIRASTS